MGIWGRLGFVLKSYVNDGIGSSHRKKPFPQNHNDDYNNDYNDDYNDAMDEIEKFLKGDMADIFPDENINNVRSIPSEIKAALEELGLKADAAMNQCKEAYKNLLKIHHPDRHAGDPVKMKTATEKTAKINAAYEKLRKWFNENKSTTSP